MLLAACMAWINIKFGGLKALLAKFKDSFSQDLNENDYPFWKGQCRIDDVQAPS